MLISVHVPKCAGTSFRHVLDGICGEEIWYNYGTIFSREQARLDLVPDGKKVIHGHFMADSFDDIIPDRELLTWARHPVERVVSNYFHCLRAPDMRDDCCRALHEHKLTLREFADLDWMQNLMTRYLANKPIGDFRFVGVSEQFDSSIRLFEDTFGWRASGATPRANTNPERRESRYRIPLGDHDFILERNLVDMAWYGQAVDRLRRAQTTRASRVA
jgi:hypothetical protein